MACCCLVSYFKLYVILKKIQFVAVLFSIFSWASSLNWYSLLLPVFYFQLIGCTLNPSLYTIFFASWLYRNITSPVTISVLFEILWQLPLAEFCLKPRRSFCCFQSLRPIIGFPSLSLSLFTVSLYLSTSYTSWRCRPLVVIIVHWIIVSL